MSAVGAPTRILLPVPPNLLRRRWGAVTTKLAELLAEATFPLHAVPPSRWEGQAFVGFTGYRSEPRVLEVVQIDYLAGVEEGPFGAVVSNLDGSTLLRADGGLVDPAPAHLMNFVSRFEEGFVERRVKRRRPVFPPRDFAFENVVVRVRGRAMGALLAAHTALPLQLARLAFRRGDARVDVGVATWELDALDLASHLQPVDLAFATVFDEPWKPTYPPPEWGEPPGQPSEV